MNMIYSEITNTPSRFASRVTRSRKRKFGLDEPVENILPTRKKMRFAERAEGKYVENFEREMAVDENSQLSTAEDALEQCFKSINFEEYSVSAGDFWNKADFEVEITNDAPAVIKRTKPLKPIEGAVEEYCKPLTKTDFWTGGSACEHVESFAVVRTQPLRFNAVYRMFIRQKMTCAATTGKMKQRPLLQLCTDFSF